MNILSYLLVVVLATCCFVDNTQAFGLITGTITISAASLALIGGVALLKAVAVKALALGAIAGSSGRFRGGNRRGKRDVQQIELEEEAAFAILVNLFYLTSFSDVIQSNSLILCFFTEYNYLPISKNRSRGFLLV